MDDFNTVEYADNYVQALVDFVAAEAFQAKFEKFFLTYAPEFTDGHELKLSYYERYKDFHEMFEEQLETFCQKMEITQAEFMRRCKSAASVDKKADHYIQILLSSVEFDTFMKLMRIMRPIAISKLKAMHGADAKSVQSSSAGAKGVPAASKAAKGDPDLDFEKEADSLEIAEHDSGDEEMQDFSADAKGEGRPTDSGSKHK